MTVTHQTPTGIQPYRNTRNDGPFRFLGIPSVMRATSDSTGGTFKLIEHLEMPAGSASPYHTHHREDESFYVLEGEMAFVCGGEWMKAAAGDFVYGPREIAHGFQVIGDSPAQMLLMCTPGGFEGFVLEQATAIAEPPSPPDMGKLMTLAAKYGIDIHGPLPEMPDDLPAAKNSRPSLKNLIHLWIDCFNRRDWKTESSLRAEDFLAFLSADGL